MKYLNCLFVLAFVVPFAFSQQPSATPETDVVRISTDLIQVDVTVTDSNGKVVRGLTPDDFELYENGDRQTISNFSFIDKAVSGAVAGDGTARAAGADPSESARQPVAAQTRRTIAIVVDDLNLSFASIYHTRKALRRFVEQQMESGDLVAIIRTGGAVGTLQQFTTDKRLLMAAIEKLRWNPLGSSGIEALMSVGQRPEDVTDRFKTESDLVASVAGNDMSKRKSILTRENVSDKKRTDYDVSKNATEQEQGLMAQASLGTIRYIVGGMKELPGRKLMLLFSDGLAIGQESNKSRSSSIHTYLRDLVDFVNRSSVVVYTFDTKGLRSMSISASDSTYEIIDGHRSAKERERLDDFRQSQDGLVFFAEQTGGKALLNSNDLNGGIRRLLDEQGGYYLLAYSPDTETFDAEKRRFNKLEVKVRRPGLNVLHRSGFFNFQSRPEAAPTLSVDQTLAKAIMSPFAANDVGLEMNAMYASDVNDGPYIRSFLHIDAKNLQFTESPEGWQTAAFDVTAVTFGDNGVPVESTATKYTIKSKGETFKTMLDRGFMYVLIMPIKMPGTYQYRVAIRDWGSGRVGSASQLIEVPDVGKKKLALSGLAVEDVSMDVWKNISEGKVGTGPGQIQIPSTLLYDTVLRRFRAGTVLRYGVEAYASSEGKKARRLKSQARIIQNDRVVVQGNVNEIDAAASPARIAGAILLNGGLQPGDYLLHLTVTDEMDKRSAVQIFPFEIVN